MPKEFEPGDNGIDQDNIGFEVPKGPNGPYAAIMSRRDFLRYTAAGVLTIFVDAACSPQPAVEAITPATAPATAVPTKPNFTPTPTPPEYMTIPREGTIDGIALWIIPKYTDGKPHLFKATPVKKTCTFTYPGQEIPITAEYYTAQLSNPYADEATVNLLARFPDWNRSPLFNGETLQKAQIGFGEWTEAAIRFPAIGKQYEAPVMAPSDRVPYLIRKNNPNNPAVDYAELAVIWIDPAENKLILDDSGKPLVTPLPWQENKPGMKLNIHFEEGKLVNMPATSDGTPVAPKPDQKLIAIDWPPLYQPVEVKEDPHITDDEWATFTEGEKSGLINTKLFYCYVGRIKNERDYYIDLQYDKLRLAYRDKVDYTKEDVDTIRQARKKTAETLNANTELIKILDSVQQQIDTQNNSNPNQKTTVIIDGNTVTGVYVQSGNEFNHYEMENGVLKKAELQPQLMPELGRNGWYFESEGKVERLRGAVVIHSYFEDCNRKFEQYKKDITGLKDNGVNFAYIYLNAAYIDKDDYIEGVCKMVEYAKRMGMRVGITFRGDGRQKGSSWPVGINTLDDRIYQIWDTFTGNPKVAAVLKNSVDYFNPCTEYVWSTPGGSQESDKASWPYSKGILNRCNGLIRQRINRPHALCGMSVPDYASKYTSTLNSLSGNQYDMLEIHLYAWIYQSGIQYQNYPVDEFLINMKKSGTAVFVGECVGTEPERFQNTNDHDFDRFRKYGNWPENLKTLTSKNIDVSFAYYAAYGNNGSTGDNLMYMLTPGTDKSTIKDARKFMTSYWNGEDLQ